MACGLCKFPVSCSQSKSPSAEGISHIDCLILAVASNHWIYTKSLSCHFTLTVKLPDIVAIHAWNIYRSCYSRTYLNGTHSIQQFAKFYFANGSLVDNLLNFPTTKVSLHTVYNSTLLGHIFFTLKVLLNELPVYLCIRFFPLWCILGKSVVTTTMARGLEQWSIAHKEVLPIVIACIQGRVLKGLTWCSY